MTLAEEAQLLFKGISNAISTWSGVEIHLSLVFSELLTGKPTDIAAVRAFYAIENFRAKLQAVDAVASYRLHGILLDKWKTIFTHLDTRSKKRNQIIHHEIKDNPSAKPGKRYELIRPMLSGKNDPPMHVRQLQEAVESFADLQEELKNFINLLESSLQP